jgi:hypothetical protein
VSGSCTPPRCTHLPDPFSLSPNHSIDKTVCLDISVLPQIMEGDVVMCTVHADAGETQDCATPVEYAANGYSASFTCAGELAPQAIAHGRCLNSHVIVAGTTLQYKCSMSQV